MENLKTNTTLYWKCRQSALPVEIPAGATIELKDGTYYISPENFEKGSITHHDAVHYGIRLNDCKEEEIPIGYFT